MWYRDRGRAGPRSGRSNSSTIYGTAALRKTNENCRTASPESAPSPPYNPSIRTPDRFRRRSRCKASHVFASTRIPPQDRTDQIQRPELIVLAPAPAPPVRRLGHPALDLDWGDFRTRRLRRTCLLGVRRETAADDDDTDDDGRFAKIMSASRLPADAFETVTLDHLAAGSAVATRCEWRRVRQTS